MSATVSGAPGSALHYSLAVTNANGSSSAPDQTVTFPPEPPTIADSTFETIVGPIARASATVNPNDSATTCYFEDTFSGAQIPCSPSPGDGSDPVSVTAGIPVHGVLMSFRVVATNAGGTTYGPRSAVAILPPPPTTPQAVPGSPAQTARPGTLKVTSIARPRRGRVAVGVVCGGASGDSCRGTIRLVAHVRLHGKLRLNALGRLRYDVAAPQHATLTVRLSPRGRRLVAQNRRLRISALV